MQGEGVSTHGAGSEERYTKTYCLASTLSIKVVKKTGFPVRDPPSVTQSGLREWGQLPRPRQSSLFSQSSHTGPLI